MKRRIRTGASVLMLAVMAATGCHPTQPFYFHEDGDLSHYLDMATEIEEPDTREGDFNEAACTLEPLSLMNRKFDEIWELSLEESICLALHNSKVLRNLGGSPVSGSALVSGSIVNSSPEQLLRSAQALPTVYDPAMVESSPGSVGRSGGVAVGGFNNQGQNPQAPGAVGADHPQGVEAALSAFDAQLQAGFTWGRLDSLRNTQPNEIFPNVNAGNNANYEIQLAKRAATGSEFFLRTQGIYNDLLQAPPPIGGNPSVWQANIEAEVRHPLLQGAGTQVNRMNVVLARINTDTSLAEFELGVRNLVSDVERAYWDLYFQYRSLQAAKIGRDASLVTWKRIKELEKAGASGGEAEQEAQARQQYFRFRVQVEAALSDLFTAETRLRYLMGLAATDGRLIRPADEPTIAKVNFDWGSILCEALDRTPELRRQRWQIKRREMELIVARNDLLPRLDAAALYRWLGQGDQLIRADGTGIDFPTEGSQAWEQLLGGDYAEWQLGFQFQMPIGFRRQLAGVRYFQLALARERARFEDMQLEATHLLSDAVRYLEAQYSLAQTNFNWRVAAEKQVQAVEAAYEAGTVTLDVLLDAQQRRSDAEIAYYQALVNYNKAIAGVHFRKGSLLEYDKVMLAEGPWPNKAYWDALGHARRRDASIYNPWGHTRPKVISRGETAQFQGIHAQPAFADPAGGGTPTPAPLPPSAINGYEDARAAPTPRAAANHPAIAKSGGGKFNWKGVEMVMQSVEPSPQVASRQPAAEKKPAARITPARHAPAPLDALPLKLVEPANYEQAVSRITTAQIGGDASGR